jgi:uncharacterized protein YjbI with pentapeptide repeats
VGEFTSVVIYARRYCRSLGWLSSMENAAGNREKKRHEDYLFEQAKLDEARFQSVVKGFESERIEARVGAAILLLTFLQKEYAKFYSQVFHLAVSLLRVRNVDPNVPEPMDAMNQALVIVLRRSFPLARDNELAKFDPTTLDASRAQLDNAYFSMTDLKKIYLRETSLRKAHFWDSNLEKANFKHSNMAGAILNHANLEKADLGDTILKDAHLSKAHLILQRKVTSKNASLSQY